MKISRSLLLLLSLGPLPVSALEFLPDPTRPAIELTVLGGAGAPRPADPAPVPAEGVQAVIIAPNYRGAIINGKQVEVGGKVGNARLVEVNERGVVLQSGQGRQVMELFSRVNIKKHALPVAAAEVKTVHENKTAVPVEAAQPEQPKHEGVSK